MANIPVAERIQLMKRGTFFREVEEQNYQGTICHNHEKVLSRAPEKYTEKHFHCTWYNHDKGGRGPRNKVKRNDVRLLDERKSKILREQGIIACHDLFVCTNCFAKEVKQLLPAREHQRRLPIPDQESMDVTPEGDDELQRQRPEGARYALRKYSQSSETQPMEESDQEVIGELSPGLDSGSSSSSMDMDLGGGQDLAAGLSPTAPPPFPPSYEDVVAAGPSGIPRRLVRPGNQGSPTTSGAGSGIDHPTSPSSFPSPPVAKSDVSWRNPKVEREHKMGVLNNFLLASSKAIRLERTIHNTWSSYPHDSQYRALQVAANGVKAILECVSPNTVDHLGMTSG